MWIKILFAFGLVVLGLGTVRGKSSIKTYFQLKNSREILENTVSSLEQENEALQKEIIKLKHSPSYARKVLRDKYHLKEENERIIFFPDE
ncbi:MAG: septum formation initiator family protein [Oligoflexales bacterium]|nr:septum formation initiator family protein [Oligoflexales bacterium]